MMIPKRLKILGKTIQLINFFIDPILITAIVFVWYYGHWTLGVFFLIATHASNRSVGGWFYAWKKESRERFKREWEAIEDDKPSNV